LKIRNLLSLLRVLFPELPDESEESDRKIQRKLVSRYAQGSVSLHMGRFLTITDVNNLKNRVTSYNYEIR
jgi:hypothetical protein